MPNEQIFTWEGITLPSYWGGNFSTTGGHAAMDQIGATGANTVTLVPNFFQSDRFSNTVKLNLGEPSWASESDTFDQVRQAILDAKARGLNVVLKPHLETDNRVWRAEIAPTEPDTWFASYTAMMVEYAKVAQAAGASMICVGTEMKSMTAAQYTPKWIALIEAVRAVFSGKVTYAATYDEVTTVGFWDQVDYIGVDAYLPLSTTTTPTVDQMVAAWTQPHFNPWIRDTLYQGMSVIDYYKFLSEQYGKQVIFTEVGYRSMDGANRDPGIHGGSGAVDNEEQADAYTALYRVMENYGGQWLAGSFLWSYHAFANPMTDAGVPYTDYTTQWKPANAVITSRYSSPEHVTGRTLTGTAVADRLDGGYHNDLIDGGGGHDRLWGGAGNDQLTGGEDNDTLTGGTGNDILQGGAGENTAVFSGAKANYSIVRNSDGTTTISDLRADHDGVDRLTDMRFATFSDQTFDLNATDPGPDPDPDPNPDPTPDPNPTPTPPSGILQGTPQADVLTGTALGDFIVGLAGNDLISGGGGYDLVFADSGDDKVFGESGNDTVFGGEGKDTISGGDGDDLIFGAFGKDVLTGGAGRDIFAFNSKLKKKEVDKILDYKPADDSLWLHHKFFKKLGKGSQDHPAKLKSGFFTIGSEAKDGNDYLFYDPARRTLFYDKDGWGEGAAVGVVTFSQKLKFTKAEIFVI